MSPASSNAVGAAVAVTIVLAAAAAILAPYRTEAAVLLFAVITGVAVGAIAASWRRRVILPVAAITTIAVLPFLNPSGITAYGAGSAVGTAGMVTVLAALMSAGVRALPAVQRPH